jgi:hypothetical protein
LLPPDDPGIAVLLSIRGAARGRGRRKNLNQSHAGVFGDSLDKPTIGVTLYFMTTITLRAHFDGEHILLDEPFDLPRDAPLMVTVLASSLEEGRAQWARLSAASLARAYGDDEPEYSLSHVKS